MSAATSLAAYVQGDGRAWRNWLADAKARGIAGAINPEDVGALG